MDRTDRSRMREGRTPRWLVVTLAAAFALALPSCKTIDVHADWDPEVDFMRLQTWKWADQAQIFTGNTTMDTDGLASRRIKNAVAGALAEKGYVETETDPADFQVAFFITVEDKTQVTTVNDYYGYGPGYGPGWGGWYGGGYGGSQTVVDTYREGTLIIDISDGKSGKLIWRGSGSARLKDKTDPATAQARANEAVTQILSKFPPPSPKKK